MNTFVTGLAVAGLVGAAYLIHKCCFRRSVEVGAGTQKRGSEFLSSSTSLALRSMSSTDPIAQIFNNNIEMFDKWESMASSKDRLKKEMFFGHEISNFLECVNKLEKQSLFYSNDAHKEIIKRLLKCFKTFFNNSDTDRSKARITKAARDFLSAISKEGIHQPAIDKFLSPYNELQTYRRPQEGQHNIG